MIPVSQLTEVAAGLALELPAETRTSSERSSGQPDVNRYYLTPVVIAASSWQAQTSRGRCAPADLATAVAADIRAAYPEHRSAEGCDDLGLIDRSGAAGRAVTHFDWVTDGGRLVRSHLVVFAGDADDVAVLHLTVPSRLADETSSMVNHLIGSARFQSQPVNPQTNPQPVSAATAANSQGVTTS